MADGLAAATSRFFAAARAVLASFAFMAVGALALLAGALPAHAGAQHNVTGWAWSGSVGWVSMNCTNGATCATADYGVTFEDTVGFPDRADLKGYAWSETVGWICFGSSCTGTSPEGAAPYAQYRASFNGKDDQLWGWAKVVSMPDSGWIALNCDHDVGPDDCGASSYHVALDQNTGSFTKGGATDHYGWGKTNEGGGAGWVDFGVVSTTWVMSNLGTIQRPEGIYEPTAAGLPGTRQFTFPIEFSNFSGGASQLLECEVLLPDGSRRVIGKTLPATIRHGVTTLTYAVQAADNVQQNRIWYITACRIASAVLGANCASDAACAAGNICDETAGKCRAVVTQSNARKPIYTHGNQWTGLDASQDQYAAIRCNAGFPDSAFRNAVRCDYTGDASFALAMRRGVPIEGDCGDNTDNDGNGQIDCADRYCKGISYRCQQLGRIACTWGQTGDGMNDCSVGGYVNGDLCCSRKNWVTDGLECTYGSTADSIYDCDEAGYQSGDLCCDAESRVIKQ